MVLIVGALVAAAVAVLFLASLQAKAIRSSNERVRYIKSYAPKISTQSHFKESDFGFTVKKSYIQNRRKTDAQSKVSAKIRFRVTLHQAGISLSTRVFILIFLASLILITFLINLAGPIFPAALLISFLASTFSLRGILNWRTQKRRDAFEGELPDFLIVLASSLRSGLPLIQSLETISHRGNGEVEREMRQAASDIALGLDPSSALLEVAKRMQSVDMSWVVLAIAIQREVGGALSTILESVAETVLQRGRVQREVRTLSAESRLSAVVLVALPIAVFIFFYFTRRTYVSIFWTTTYGIVLSVIMVTLALIGIFWMRRIVNIKV